VNGAGPPRGPVRILFLHPMDFLNETIDVRGYDEQISGEPGPGFQYVCRAPLGAHSRPSRRTSVIPLLGNHEGIVNRADDVSR